MQTQTVETPQSAETQRSRWWLVALVVLGLAAIGGVIWAISSSDGENALPDVLQEWEESLVAGDATAMAALYTEDAVHYDRPLHMTLTNQAGIRRGMASAMAVVDVREVELRNVEETAESIVTQAQWTGTSDGQEFTTDMEATFVLDGDLIAYSEFVYDPDTMWFE